MSVSDTADGSRRNTSRYEHLPHGTSWWLYDDLNNGEVIAERIGNGDKMRFESWRAVENSEYWVQEG